jgi:hypothetical protein
VDGEVPTAAKWNGHENKFLAGINNVESAQLVDGTIVNADINASAAVVASKLDLTPVAQAVTLDDGTGDSPILTLQDATDETAAITKVDSSFLQITTVAADGVNILTGNLKVGNGTPSVSLDGEDAYVEGTFEVDGTSNLAGDVTLGGDITITGDDIFMTTNTDGMVFVADGTNFNPVQVSGDVEIDNTGATTIQNNSVDGTDIALGSDAQGDVYYYDGTDVARLAAGDAGQVYTSGGSGANPSWGDPPVDVFSYSIFYDDFFNVDSDTSAGGHRIVVSQYPWCVGGTTVDSSQGVNGLWEIDGDGSANDGELFLTDGSGTADSDFATPFKAAKNPVVIIRWKNDNGAASGQICRLGLASAFADSADPANGVWLEWDGNARDINIVTDAAAQTTTDTTYNSDTATFHVFKIKFTSTTQVDVYVDGASSADATVTTNIPSDDLGIFFNSNAVTANRGVIIDYIYIRQDR